MSISYTTLAYSLLKPAGLTALEKANLLNKKLEEPYDPKNSELPQHLSHFLNSLDIQLNQHTSCSKWQQWLQLHSWQGGIIGKIAKLVLSLWPGLSDRSKQMNEILFKTVNETLLTILLEEPDVLDSLNDHVKRDPRICASIVAFGTRALSY